MGAMVPAYFSMTGVQSDIAAVGSSFDVACGR